MAVSFVTSTLHDLAVQLSVNSNIAGRKMRLFSCGVVMVIVAGVSLLLLAVVLAYHTPEHHA